MSDQVTLSKPDAGTAQILIDRPERHNAMTIPMYETLLALIRQCQNDTSVRCILIRGSGGKSFVSGTDIDYFTALRDGRQGIAYEALVERVIDAVERIRVPTVAVIDGWAVGGGLALATACDFRVCSGASRFGAPIAKTLSNTLSSRNLARLHAAFGTPRVKKMLLLAEFLDAGEALACGYVYDVCDQDMLDSVARSLAQRLIGLSAVTQQAAKESLRRIVVEQRMDDDDLVEAVYGSAEFRNAVTAFTSGRLK
ncbi:enoyl-CoA hydratase/carnithine racemase [Paraburkholderia silvatlantica]|uniref:Enoyl-CoA hydratase/carnithine racemase n=1 Tax=Paraburkholderia silvatlantica TaxID=321895 RepID=A0A2V4U7X5_9BURK|nr:enoyl-CoA hydratase [Paraburkholderia silvatlantica]PYE19574.1 enoyl-CoA hydratase/carnithine racemase [Paraburkholderia silvatlantica]